MKQVTVENLEKGFQINVISEKNCPGLLVTILEAFEELGLNVVEARVSCTGNFHLEAVGEVRDQKPPNPKIKLLLHISPPSIYFIRQVSYFHAYIAYNLFLN